MMLNSEPKSSSLAAWLLLSCTERRIIVAHRTDWVALAHLYSWQWLRLRQEEFVTMLIPSNEVGLVGNEDQPSA